ncbi:hypothetical protein SNOG_13357 [Parastagonospora nodorum SN15]|uniref:Uncharacterized protein n=1 Tax=Phaeosphaeria nodorum (strain SN15 / ATCC MYA-4574 / FGSC 10173) TaxID=321614 RepID=Q0U4F7_PHANO|nr:hypothetical protein SNOG_13357 [Parastagonospora nodorum SN15]EAT79241.2 hypothetical protein SNOG_13357 [Parastagonospora nodorum SN15]
MGIGDAQNLKSEAEILARQSRPQRSSTWIPKTRDWRYATGVIQHDDFDDAPKSRSVWDTLDYDYQVGEEAVHTTKSTGLRNLPASPSNVAPYIIDYKPMTMPKSGWMQVKRLKRSDTPDVVIGVANYETMALIVRLHFTRETRAQVKAILEGLDSIKSLHAFPLFKRAWVDETYDFNAAAVRSKIRPIDRAYDELGANYHWYNDAVPADAVFPPGVPISAKEISAFYPHHVRWKGVMVRLTKNDYRGPDIMGMQRDAVKTSLPGFKTARYKGKSDCNLRTDQLVPGPYIESMSKGYTLPSFEDLVRGLRRLPSGLDARGLTTCVSWYLNIRDTFTPKLELNVLHTQALIRALREPLKPFGPQNLDRNALEEWRNRGSFETVEIEHKKRQHQPVADETTQDGRSQLHLNLDQEDVSMKATLPLRHIMTFPFLALHGVFAEALKLGIKKAEVHRAARKEEAHESAPKRSARTKSQDVEMADEKEQIASGPDKTPEQPLPEESNEPHRIPKRPLAVETSELSSHKKLHIPSGPRNPTPPLRPLAPAPLPEGRHLANNKPNPYSYYDYLCASASTRSWVPKSDLDVSGLVGSTSIAHATTTAPSTSASAGAESRSCARIGMTGQHTLLRMDMVIETYGSGDRITMVEIYIVLTMGMAEETFMSGGKSETVHRPSILTMATIEETSKSGEQIMMEEVHIALTMHTIMDTSRGGDKHTMTETPIVMRIDEISKSCRMIGMREVDIVPRTGMFVMHRIRLGLIVSMTDARYGRLIPGDE